MPRPNRSLLAAPLVTLARLATRLPKTVLIFGLLVALASGVFAWQRLGFKTSRLDLLNPSSDYNRLWLAYLDQFGDQDDAVILVEGKSRVTVTACVEDIARQLEREPDLFQSVFWQVDLRKIRGKGLHYLPDDSLRRVEQYVQSALPTDGTDWRQLGLTSALDHQLARLRQAESVGDQRQQSEAIESARAWLVQTRAALDGQSAVVPPNLNLSKVVGDFQQLDRHFLLTKEGRWAFIQLKLADDETGFSVADRQIERLREIIVQVTRRHADVKIGLTGLPVMENDEMHASQDATIRATVISLIGVAGLFIAGFGGIRYPLLTIATLILAMIWSLGYITLAVGHLNILSVSFAVILIGLGIDFGIHYVVRYASLRRSVHSSRTALLLTARRVGPGIVTGGVTSALAFFAAGLTHFTGIAELGVIAGGGILLCVVSAVLILPALVFLQDRNRTSSESPVPLKVHNWLAPVLRFPRTVLITGASVTAVLSIGCLFLRYDHNLMNLQPVGQESVAIEQKLLRESDHSVWFAVSMADDEQQLEDLRRKYEKLPTVERVEDIRQFLFGGEHMNTQAMSLLGFDPKNLARVNRIDNIHRRLSIRPLKSSANYPCDSREMVELITRADRDLIAIPKYVALRGQARAVVRQIEKLGTRGASLRLTAFQHRLFESHVALLGEIAAISNPQRPTLEDLPGPLRDRFVGHDGRLLLKVYGRGNVWDMADMKRFVEDVKSVDPVATGQPLQTFYASMHMQDSYIHAAMYALVAVAIVLILDFGSVRYSCLALLPVAVGSLLMFGLMGWFDIPLNPANMIVLPLILGIGIDDGVHVVHDYLKQSGRYRLGWSTATAVLITSLTTMVGFGSLMIADHRGLQSLGRVLTIGVGCCLLTSIVLLPALLTLFTNRRAGKDPPAIPQQIRAAAWLSARRAKSAIELETTAEPSSLDFEKISA